MRRILIVGAGQAGLQLALSLQSAGYDVTVMSSRTPDELRSGRIMSTQVMFSPSLKLERDRGLNFWDDKAPKVVGQRSTLAVPPGAGEKAFTFVGRWDEPAQSVDQRVKMSTWLELFESRGGRVVYHGVMTSDLGGLAELYDLTIIAAGKGELVELFDRDAEKSPYETPQRQLSCIYLHGGKPMPEYPEPHVRITMVPGVGELIYMPGYTHTGAADIVLWEAVPGGPWDIWSDKPDPKAHLERSLGLMREYMPWEHDLFTEAEPTDARCTLYGGFPPVVRRPVGELPGGAAVLGMGDVVVTNDPCTGQGSNNASHCAAIYEEAIRAHGDKPFDRDWMQRTFDAYWAYAKNPTEYTNMILSGPPEHVQKVLATAAENPKVAYRFVLGSAVPADFAEWIMDPADTEAYLASVS